MKHSSNFLILLLSLLLINGCDTQKPMTDEAIVVSVTDGDTFKAMFKGKKEKIRLIGIDTPESSRNPKAKKDAQKSRQKLDEIIAMGKEATKFARKLLRAGDKVKLEFDVSERDKYGRLLCYVYLKDGRMLNEVMVKEGYAYVMTYPPDVKYQQKFLAAFKYARENNKGLWGM
ncbi:MAG: thermonuclease family protein [Ignavibacteriaceae bacterium]|nr:MAG: thermonuclease family protein [Ignavibacteriaceae bacterium]MBW7872961.1 thermonuclease family protein [Ignavibacteria bacterium]